MESINLSMSTVSSCLAANACPSERNFFRHPTLQNYSKGAEVMELQTGIFFVQSDQCQKVLQGHDTVLILKI